MLKLKTKFIIQQHQRFSFVSKLEVVWKFPLKDDSKFPVGVFIWKSFRLIFDVDIYSKSPIGNRKPRLRHRKRHRCHEISNIRERQPLSIR